MQEEQNTDSARTSSWSVLLFGVAVMGLGALAVISPRLDDPTPPPIALAETSSMHNPMRKIAFFFSVIRNHPMTDGTKRDIPWADAAKGDRAIFTLTVDGRKYRTEDVTLDGPPRNFCVAVILPAIDLEGLTFSASMTRTSWHGKGQMPQWESAIHAHAFTRFGNPAVEREGVRVCDEKLDSPLSFPPE